MAKKHESKRNIEDLTEAEIYALIRYLEPDPRTRNKEPDDTAALVLSVIFVILVFGLGFMLLYH
jgi:hypothetical protein